MKNHYIFLGFVLPESEMTPIFQEDRSPQVQTHKFSWNLIKAIEANRDFEISYISSKAVSDYPNYPHKKVTGRIWEVDEGAFHLRIREISFHNTSLLKIPSRFFHTLAAFLKEYKKKQTKGLIIYSVHVPYMLLGYLLAKCLKLEVIAIWTDPPSVKAHGDSFLKDKLRGFERSISEYLMKRVDKVIALTKYLAADFAPNKPYLVIEGIINPSDSKAIGTDEIRQHDEIKVVYTGSISSHYGLNNIVEAFKKFDPSSQIILEVYGKGDYVETLKQVEQNYPHIRYKGFKTYAEILSIQREADFLINARASTDDYVKYSFPSKTLEYMLSGTPLITTLLPGIPEEYRPFLIVLKDNAPHTIYDCLLDLKSMPLIERQQFGEKAETFALTKDYLHQGKKIVDFIDEEVDQVIDT